MKTRKDQLNSISFHCHWIGISKINLPLGSTDAGADAVNNNM